MDIDEKSGLAHVRTPGHCNVQRTSGHQQHSILSITLICFLREASILPAVTSSLIRMVQEDSIYDESTPTPAINPAMHVVTVRVKILVISSCRNPSPPALFTPAASYAAFHTLEDVALIGEVWRLKGQLGRRGRSVGRR